MMTKHDLINEVSDLYTVRDFIRYAVTRFNKANLYFGHGTDNAYDEAVYLVLHALHLPLDDLEPYYACRLTSSEKWEVADLINERVEKRTPLPYLTGEAFLRGHRFLTSPHVIVPRSPIAELIQDQFSPWVECPQEVENILDMCTGSGCLAILAALYFENALVDGVDISEDAIELANKNHSLYQLDDRVQFLQSDLFERVPPQMYDVIICNPPYVNEESMQSLPDEYRQEPYLALAGGKDGMDFIRPFLMQAKDFIKPDGFIVLEIGHELDHFQAAFPEIEPIVLETQGATQSVVLIKADQLY